MSTNEAFEVPAAAIVRRSTPSRSLLTKAALQLAKLLDDVRVDEGLRPWLISKLPCQMFDDIPEGHVPEDAERLILIILAGGGVPAEAAVKEAVRAAMSRRSWVKEKAKDNIRKMVALENAGAPEEPASRRQGRKPETTETEQDSSEEEEKDEKDQQGTDEEGEEQQEPKERPTANGSERSFRQIRVLQDPSLWQNVPNEDDRDLRYALAERYLQTAKPNTWARTVAENLIDMAVMWATRPRSTEIPTMALDLLERTRVYHELGPAAAEKFAATVKSETFHSRYAKAARQAERSKEKATKATKQKESKTTTERAKEPWVPKSVLETFTPEQKEKFFNEKKSYPKKF
jgi:hypothetical protein